MKRGEATMTFYLVTTILVIVGFGIVFYFLFQLNVTDTANDELCRLSVLSRATAPESVNTYIPLQCTTRKVCLTTAFINGKCKEFTGEQNVVPVKLEGDTANQARIIEKEIANQMFDCWSMFGQGKLSLFSGGFMKQYQLKETQLSCVFCSRIAFDIPDAKQKEEIFKKINLNEYLTKTKIPNTNKRYIEAFTDQETNTFPSYSGTIENQLEKIKSTSSDRKEITSSNEDELSIVFSQTHPPSYKETLGNLANAGIAVAGSSFLSPGIGSFARSSAANPTGLAVVGIGAIGVTAYSMSNVYAGRTAAAGYCGKFVSQRDPNEKTYPAPEDGCSAVQVLPYDYDSLKNVCTRVEGNP